MRARPAFDRAVVGQASLRWMLDAFWAGERPTQLFFRYNVEENAVNGGTPGR